MDRPYAPDNQIEDVLNKYADTILRIAWQNMGNRTDAEDITQEVFLRWMTMHPDFAGEEHQRAWLIRVAINLCKNDHKAARRKDLPLESAAEKGKNDSQTEVMEAVGKLPQNYRNVIYLYYFEGYSTAEIADILETKQNTISSWLHRARTKLKWDLTGGA